MISRITKLLRRVPVPHIGRLDRTVLLAVIIAGIAGIALVTWFFSGSTQIEIANRDDTGPRSFITDLPCPDPHVRPVAIMLASDPEARPLSGISAAEIVLEMPVTPNGITRMMAVFQCTLSEEIGSIRSARQDFLGLVQGMDAIYAHWGGERDALAALDNGLLDNIDALAYEGTVFYRKPDIPPPHNGFTTIENLLEQAEKLGYDTSWSDSSWPHRSTKPRRSLFGAVGSFTISYPTGSHIRWTYEKQSNLWSRNRDGSPEIDALTSQPVRAGAVIILFTDSTFLREQYISVRMQGTGDAVLYQDGMRKNIRWQRSESGMLSFTDENGMSVGLAPGPVWIAVATQGITVK